MHHGIVPSYVLLLVRWWCLCGMTDGRPQDNLHPWLLRLEENSVKKENMELSTRVKVLHPIIKDVVEILGNAVTLMPEKETISSCQGLNLYRQMRTEGSGAIGFPQKDNLDIAEPRQFLYIPNNCQLSAS